MQDIFILIIMLHVTACNILSTSFCRDKQEGEKEAEERSSWLLEEQATGGMEDSFIGEVQGPINKEPYEKIYGKPESGIRKL